MTSVRRLEGTFFFMPDPGGGKLMNELDWEARTGVVPGRWCLEMAVPFKSLTASCPEPGERWRLNIIRYRQAEAGETSCWQCMYGSPHRTDLTGTIQFSVDTVV